MLCDAGRRARFLKPIFSDFSNYLSLSLLKICVCSVEGLLSTVAPTCRGHSQPSPCGSFVSTAELSSRHCIAPLWQRVTRNAGMCALLLYPKYHEIVYTRGNSRYTHLWLLPRFYFLSRSVLLVPGVWPTSSLVNRKLRLGAAQKMGG